MTFAQTGHLNQVTSGIMLFFLDEVSFNLFNSDGKSWVWKEMGERLNPDYTTRTLKYGRGKVMLWDCFSSKGVRKLVMIEGNMDKFQYVNILANNLSASAEMLGLEEFIFQQDNDPKHKSGYTMDYFNAKGINVLEWPSKSPDLNPIANL